jgi:hypothetical protein
MIPSSETPPVAPAPLPGLAAIFKGIKAGHHWSFGDPEYTDLSSELFEGYRAFFAQLELTLHRDTRGFIYATADDDDFKGSDTITRFVLFTAVWVDAVADAGDDILKTLFAERLSPSELPHFANEANRRLLAQAGIKTPADIQNLLRNMERLGLLDMDSQGRFTLRPPFHRLLDVCLESAKNDPPAESQTDATEPESVPSPSQPEISAS